MAKSAKTPNVPRSTSPVDSPWGGTLPSSGTGGEATTFPPGTSPGSHSQSELEPHWHQRPVVVACPAYTTDDNGRSAGATNIRATTSNRVLASFLSITSSLLQVRSYSAQECMVSA